MKHYIQLLLLVCCLGIAEACQAKWARPQLENVPIDRLLANLQKQTGTKTNDVETFYALARVHSMAYASPLTEVEVRKENGQPFFGYGLSGSLPPLKPNQAGETNAAAKAHLQQAIAFYKKAVRINPEHAPSQLGLGWSLDQAGDKKAALGAYRKALQAAWQLEQKKKLYAGQGMTEEAADYMLPLLDPVKDAKEIETIKQYKTTMKAKPRFITPILIPLQEPVTDLESLIDANAKVRFDLDGSRLPRSWQWITPKAAWLVYDHDGGGKITSGIQMIGGVTFWIFWENGYHALATLDDDGDGLVSGTELKGLALWHDGNGNGISEPGEVKPLSKFGITSLSTHYESHPSGIPFNPEGVTFSDGTTRPSYDWIAKSESK